MAISLQTYWSTLGVTFAGDKDDRQLTMAFGPILIGRPGFLHGGAIAGILSLACDVLAGDDARCFTSTFQFLRAAREGDLHAIASLARGSSIATLTAFAWQDDRARPVASTCRKYRIN
nr:PaaI family thioesterase [Sphingomonas sp. CDS-1]